MRGGGVEEGCRLGGEGEGTREGGERREGMDEEWWREGGKRVREKVRQVGVRDGEGGGCMDGAREENCGRILGRREEREKQKKDEENRYGCVSKRILFESPNQDFDFT